jgi:outer membrane receptor protein involved in Fe transport
LALAALLLVVSPSWAADGGGVVGWVEDAKGMPVAGALVSLFGKGLQGGGLITVSDTTGRFMLPALPAGSYTLRALGDDGATARRVTVLPGRDSIFTLSFAPQPTGSDLEDVLERVPPAERELRWLLRHKKRSVLESSDPEPRTASADAPQREGDLLGNLVPWVPELGGAVQWTASSAVSTGGDGVGEASSPNVSSLRLEGRLADGHWNLSGLLTDAESGSWRMAAEFAIEPASSHRLRAGAGYGTWLLQPLVVPGGDGSDGRNAGAVFAEDRWQASDRLALGAGARYTYVGFLQDRNHVSPTASLEYRLGRRTRLRASSSSRTLTPGGDILTLSTLATTPAMAVALMGEDVRAERILRHELGLEHRLGAGRVTSFLFREGVRDRLLNVIDRHDARSLRIFNGRGLVVEGVGAGFDTHLGGAFTGSVTYTFGRSWPGEDERLAPGGLAGLGEANFHDIVARGEAFVDATGTRVVAYYRVNALRPDAEGLAGSRAQMTQRFDVQLMQVLPFLTSMTRAEWEVLVAFRNLFYEAPEAATLDEIAVVNPPTRVVGGISVRF